MPIPERGGSGCRRPPTRCFATRQVHLILDNHATHRHRKVKAWRKATSRFHFHFTPAYSSWLNPVEHWFSTLQHHDPGLLCRRGRAADHPGPHCTCTKNLRIGALD
ncbi:MAG: hypothetical protein F4Y08_06475 [Caldilineaceae bacterium SB0662_bin_9]|uniref:Tc1-like transposase DDE domain-containing protein n=1 Tax=Caldilineaceae bacterium SB0662_bin_9 TaxID=2605258 RepID=A0A6B1DRZ8_9CHLR|nr:hypothetical protein [Caldilineaceae bacterium SB0662_bin_9]